jgi:hypothetical protein
MGATDVDPYYLWRKNYDWVVDYTEPFATAIQIDGNAVLRLRDKRGKESRIVLAGLDPLTISRDGLHGEIMQFHWSGRQDYLTLQVLIKTDSPIAEGTAKELTREYVARLGVPRMDLVFRTDCWFVDEGFYPGFAGCGQPPSEDELRRTVSLNCYSSTDPVRCNLVRWNWKLP